MDPLFSKLYVCSIFDVTTAQIDNGDYTFRVTGSRLKFDGYLKIYDNYDEEDEDGMLPSLEKNELLDLLDLQSEQNFTQPPPRF